MRADEQELDMRQASWALVAKPTSIKGTECKSSGCAWQAVELTSGDLLPARIRDWGARDRF